MLRRINEVLFEVTCTVGMLAIGMGVGAGVLILLNYAYHLKW